MKSNGEQKRMRLKTLFVEHGYWQRYFSNSNKSVANPTSTEDTTTYENLAKKQASVTKVLFYWKFQICIGT